MGSDEMKTRSIPNFAIEKSADSFLSKINYDAPDGCWEWTGTKHKNGYGVIMSNNKLILTHRFSWMHFHGPIPQKLCICHKCDNPSCVNPDHLFLGTQLDNIKDMLAKGRNKPPTRHRKILKNEEADEIRKMYKPGKSDVPKTKNQFSQVALGIIFGVSATEINKIVKNPHYYPMEENS